MWRPDDWESIAIEKTPELNLCDPDPRIADNAFEAGADAMIPAIIELLGRIGWQRPARDLELFIGLGIPNEAENHE